MILTLVSTMSEKEQTKDLDDIYLMLKTLSLKLDSTNRLLFKIMENTHATDKNTRWKHGESHGHGNAGRGQKRA